MIRRTNKKGILILRNNFRFLRKNKHELNVSPGIDSPATKLAEKLQRSRENVFRNWINLIKRD